MALVAPEQDVREPLPGRLSHGRCKALARDLERRATAAWDRGNKGEYDQLVRERVALRQFMTECYGRCDEITEEDEEEVTEKPCEEDFEAGDLEDEETSSGKRRGAYQFDRKLRSEF